MGDYYDMHAQQRTEEGWIVPPSVPESSGYTLGHLFEFRAGSAILMELFLGDEALLPLKTDFPPDFRDTELFKERVLDWEPNFCGWAPMADLLVDEWSESYLLVSRSVPGQFAEHFASGDQLFPKQALLDAGCPEDELGWMENVPGGTDPLWKSRRKYSLEVVQQPIVQRLRGVDLPRSIEVTWKVCIAQFLGERKTAALRSLRSEVDDRDLRVICLFGG